MRRFVQPAYAELRRVSRAGFGVILIRRQGRERNSYEIYEVIACKCHGKGESSEKNYNTENINLESIKNL